MKFIESKPSFKFVKGYGTVTLV